MIKDFKKYLQNKDISPATQKNYLSDVRSFFIWIQTQKVPEQKPGNWNSLLSKKCLWQYCQFLISANKLSQNTVKRKLAGLKKFCQWTVEKGLVNNNPFESKEIGKIEAIRETLPAGRQVKGVKGVKREALKIGLVLASLLAGIIVLRLSLVKFPLPEVPETIPLPVALPVGKQGQVLSQTSGFGSLGQIGEIGLTASQSATLASLTKQGQLRLPQSLGLEAQEISLKTTDGYDGNITINPDGRGTFNLLFEGQSPKEIASPSVGGFVNIQNANLAEGNLIHGAVANDQTSFNFLDFRGGTALKSRFAVAGSGNLAASGNLALDGGQISSLKNLIFSPQDQPTLTLAPKESLLKGNLVISGQLVDAGLGIFGTTGQVLPQTFDFTKELTVEFEFLTGNTNLIIKFNLNKAQTKYYQAVWQTNNEFAIYACDSACNLIGSAAFYPFEEYDWNHGGIYINDSYLTWELDLSAQKVRVQVQIEDFNLIEKGYIQFSERCGF